MARVNYYATEEALADWLRADADLRDRCLVLIEPSAVMNEGDVVAIYLNRRETPPGIQTLSAGTRTTFRLYYSIWCYGFAIDLEGALRARDDLVGRVEIALMRSRNGDINQTFEISWLEGGDFDNPPSQEGYFSGAEVIFVAEISAVTQ